MNAPGLDPTSAYSRHVAARFSDFTNPKTPWSRRLWGLGTFLALEELHDVGVWLDRQVLNSGAVRWLKHSLETQLGEDVAFGTRELRQQLTHRAWPGGTGRSAESDKSARGAPSTRACARVLPQLLRSQLINELVHIVLITTAAMDAILRSRTIRLVDQGIAWNTSG